MEVDQAGGRSGLREERKGLHVEPPVVAGEGHGGAHGMEGGSGAVQVVLTARGTQTREGISHTRPRVRARVCPDSVTCSTLRTIAGPFHRFLTWLLQQYS